MSDERRGSNAFFVDLRVFLEKLIDHERELRDQNANSLARELVHQAAEYERRLTSLNNEYARADKVRDEYLQKQVFEIHQREYHAWKLEIVKTLSESRGSSNRVAMTGIILAGIAFLMNIITVVWRIFSR